MNNFKFLPSFVLFFTLYLCFHDYSLVASLDLGPPADCVQNTLPGCPLRLKRNSTWLDVKTCLAPYKNGNQVACTKKEKPFAEELIGEYQATKTKKVGNWRADLQGEFPAVYPFGGVFAGQTVKFNNYQVQYGGKRYIEPVFKDGKKVPTTVAHAFVQQQFDGLDENIIKCIQEGLLASLDTGSPGKGLWIYLTPAST